MQLGPTKLIAIRSGSFEYAEVDLSNSLQLVGPNNAGKTTLINTLQFLYIDQRNHMVFGDHEPDATREYYFPDQYSYLLFECGGPMGPYVLGWRGQSKTSGGDPVRFTYTGLYEVDDFLTDDGLVAPPKQVLPRLEKKGYRELRDPSSHREAILVATKGESNGLGVVHLTETERYGQFKEVLKNLLSLRSIDQHEMKRSLLMLAGLPPNKPALEANRLMTEEFERIRDRRVQLNTLKSEQDRLRLYIERSVVRQALEARLAFIHAELQEKQRKAHDHNHQVKEAIAAKQIQLEHERKAMVESLKELDDRIAELAGGKGRLQGDLSRIHELGRGLGQFTEKLEREALHNAKERLTALDRQLGNAQLADRDRTARSLAEAKARVDATEKAIHGFDRALITLLRDGSQEEDLRDLARLFNIHLLKLPVEKGAVEVRKKKQLLEAIRTLASRIKEGRYTDPLVSIPLPDEDAAWHELVDVKALKEALVHQRAELERLQELMTAIENRENLLADRDALRTEIERQQEKFVRWDRYEKEKDAEADLNRQLEAIGRDQSQAESRRANTRGKLDEISVKIYEQRTALSREDERFNRMMRLLEQCPPPPVVGVVPAGPVAVPQDAEDAIAQYQKLTSEHKDLVREMDGLRAKIESVLRSEIIGANEQETVRLMNEQLDGLPVFEEALRKDWDNYLHLLRANFANVLNGLADIKAAAERLNLRFCKVSVSNLQSLRMEVLDQSDLVEPLKELAETDHTGLFDDSRKLDAAYMSFRNKLSERITLNYGDLFTLRFSVKSYDGRTHSYDNLQVESHGTAITIKVLFNLLVLRSLLKEDARSGEPLSRVPFFLDEVHSLDATNRHSVLRMAQDLGFLALTAAPEPVSEVGSLYFLRPQNGKLVVRNERRVKVEYDTASVEA